MNGNRLVARIGLTSLLVLSGSFASAMLPTNPTVDRDFYLLPNGRDMRTIEVSGSKLSLSRGSGNDFGASAQAAYEKLKQDSKNNPNHKVQWVLMDLDNNHVIDQSASAGKKKFGASVAKIYVAATLMDRQDGKISASQLQLMSDMLVVSSNTAWTNLQKQVGSGDADTGRQRIEVFTKRLGYVNTHGFQGYLGKIHGNELNALELADYLRDTYKGAYAGAETVWKLMHTCRTGASRGRKYIPSKIYVAAKTGTYDGSTENPETGGSMVVRVRNHIMAFNIEGREYGLAILADTGSDESAAVLAGGLIREYAIK